MAVAGILGRTLIIPKLWCGADRYGILEIFYNFRGLESSDFSWIFVDIGHGINLASYAHHEQGFWGLCHRILIQISCHLL